MQKISYRDHVTNVEALQTMSKGTKLQESLRSKNWMKFQGTFLVRIWVKYNPKISFRWISISYSAGMLMANYFQLNDMSIKSKHVRCQFVVLFFPLKYSLEPHSASLTLALHGPNWHPRVSRQILVAMDSIDLTISTNL